MTGRELQEILDNAPSGSTVRLPAGVINIERNPGVGNPDRLSDLRIRRSLTLMGHSEGTTLSMVGDGNRRLLDVLGGEVRLVDIEFSGAHRGATGEQTHLVHCSGGSTAVSLCRFTLPETGDTTGGDGIKVAGGALEVTDSQFVACDRSGISVHHGGPVTITDCHFVGTGDSDIDVEPPSDVIVTGITISGCTTERTNTGVSSVALTRCSGAVVSNCVLDGELLLISARAPQLLSTEAPSLTVRRSTGVTAAGGRYDDVLVLGDDVAASRGVFFLHCDLGPVIVDDSESVYFVGGNRDSCVVRANIRHCSGGAFGVPSSFTGPMLFPRDHGITWTEEV